MKGQFAKPLKPRQLQKLSQVPTESSTQVSTPRDGNSAVGDSAATALFLSPDRMMRNRSASRNGFSMANLLRMKGCISTSQSNAQEASASTDVKPVEFDRSNNVSRKVLSIKPSRSRLSPEGMFLILTEGTQISFSSHSSKFKPPQVHRKTVPKWFINLPKLPFGVHRSYNDEKEIRSLLVTKRWKAWRRGRKTTLRWSYDDYYASFL